ncbi:MAG: glycosyltransferase family 39 protein [Armatimonadota bacterium]|nr:glycosyltransferase family 39 protein [Armatimonadota bacterium]
MWNRLHEWWPYLAVVAGTLALNLAGLGASKLWDQDETKYAQVAREILWTGDWLTLRWNGDPWFVHPPLYFWLVAATARFFGLTEFTARVWSAVFGAGAVALTALLGRAWFSPRAGWLAGLVVATTLQWFAQSRLAVFDSVLVFWMLGTLLGFWTGYRGRRTGYLAAFVCAGLGTLTKGPVAAVLPGLVALAYLAWRRELRRLREIPWAAGLALYGLVGLSWYAAGYLRHGAPFLRSVLGYYTVHRFVGVVENQAGPLWYYVPVLLLGGLPWNALWLAWPHLFRRGGEPMPLVWCAVVFVFFSAAGTKLPNYVLAFYPLAAVATGAALDAFWDRPGKLRWGFAALAGLWVLFCAAVAAYGLWLYPAESRAVFPVVAVPLLVFGAGVLGGAAFGLRGNTGAAVTALASGAVAFFLLLAWQVMPEVDRHRPHREVAHAAAAWTRGDEVRVAYWVPNSLVFYSGRTWRAYLDPEPVRREVCAAGARRVVLVAPQARLQELRPAVDGFRTLQELRGWKVLEKPEGRVVRCP